MMKIWILNLCLKAKTIILAINKRINTKLKKLIMAFFSFLSFNFFVGWELSTLILLTVFLHELGHIQAMKKIGIKTKGFYFVPFLGGISVPEKCFPDYKSESFVAIGGPLAGFVFSVLAISAYFVFQYPIFLGAAAFMLFVNLFNLLPLSALDGGKALKSLAFSVNRGLGATFLCANCAVCAWITFTGPNIFWLLAASALAEVGIMIYEIRLGRAASDDYSVAYRKQMNGKEKRFVLASYIGLASLLYFSLVWVENLPEFYTALESLGIRGMII